MARAFIDGSMYSTVIIITSSVTADTCCSTIFIFTTATTRNHSSYQLVLRHQRLRCIRNRPSLALPRCCPVVIP